MARTPCRSSPSHSRTAARAASRIDHFGLTRLLKAVAKVHRVGQKAELRRPKWVRIGLFFRISGFGLLSAFGFRPSDFGVALTSATGFSQLALLHRIFPF